MIKKYIAITVLLCVCLITACQTKETIYLERNIAEEETQTESAAPLLENQTQEQKEREQVKYFVYICGAVNHPGVYEVSEGARIYEAINLAGGLAQDAAAESVNQAREVTDGEMVWIPTKEEAQTKEAQAKEVEDADGRIDLNQATAEELMTLAGIGRAKADSIIAYRKKCGGFSSTEEIMQVEGIKEGVYNRIKDDIKVK